MRVCLALAVIACLCVPSFTAQSKTPTRPTPSPPSPPRGAGNPQAATSGQPNSPSPPPPRGSHQAATSGQSNSPSPPPSPGNSRVPTKPDRKPNAQPPPSPRRNPPPNAEAAPKTAPAPPPARPNFLVLLVDDLGFGDIGPFGNRTLPTPSLDALAAGGAVLRQSLAAAAVCTPSRAALLTGRLPVRYGLAPENNEWDVSLFAASKVSWVQIGLREDVWPRLDGSAVLLRVQ